MSGARSPRTDTPPARCAAPEDRPFWDALEDGRLVLARCDCGACYTRFQACLVCPAGTRALTWVAASGRGTVRSFVVFDKAYHPYFTELLPYVVGIVTLAEGPELVTNVIDVEVDAVHVGMPVRIVSAARGGQTIHQASARL